MPSTTQSNTNSPDESPKLYRQVWRRREKRPEFVNSLEQYYETVLLFLDLREKEREIPNDWSRRRVVEGHHEEIDRVLHRLKRLSEAQTRHSEAEELLHKKTANSLDLSRRAVHSADEINVIQRTVDRIREDARLMVWCSQHASTLERIVKTNEKSLNRIRDAIERESQETAVRDERWDREVNLGPPEATWGGFWGCDVKGDLTTDPVTKFARECLYFISLSDCRELAEFQLSHSHLMSEERHEFHHRAFCKVRTAQNNSYKSLQVLSNDASFALSRIGLDSTPLHQLVVDAQTLMVSSSSRRDDSKNELKKQWRRLDPILRSVRNHPAVRKERAKDSTDTIVESNPQQIRADEQVGDDVARQGEHAEPLDPKTTLFEAMVADAGPLEFESGNWIESKRENINIFGLKVGTLAQYRKPRNGGWVGVDGWYGVDRDKRIWRKPDRYNEARDAPTYYYVPSLPESRK